MTRRLNHFGKRSNTSVSKPILSYSERFSNQTFVTLGTLVVPQVSTLSVFVIYVHTLSQFYPSMSLTFMDVQFHNFVYPRMVFHSTPVLAKNSGLCYFVTLYKSLTVLQGTLTSRRLICAFLTIPNLGLLYTIP